MADEPFNLRVDRDRFVPLASVAVGVACGKAFGVPGRSTTNTLSLDYSLQLAIGLRNCDTWRGLGGLPNIEKAERRIAESSEAKQPTSNRMTVILSDADRSISTVEKSISRTSKAMSASLESLSDQAREPERECSLNLAEINK